MPLVLPPGLTPPRFATPRNFSRPTYGQHVAAVAALRGRPLTPMQRYIADVAGEVDPETGVLFYAQVVITVQRQTGKSELTQADGITKTLLGPERYVWYTAQSGQHASDHFKGMANRLELMPKRDPLRRLVKSIRRSNGTEHLLMVNGSTWRPFPPIEGALDGKQADKIDIDEAWFHSEVRGSQLMQSVGPTMTTRRMAVGQRPQTWIMSTEGTIESTWFNQILDDQRARNLEDGQRVAFFDWGLLPDDDPTDLNVVASRHPGFGHLLDMETLQDMFALYKDAPNEFARAYGNRRTGATERIFPAGDWQNAQFTDPLPDGRVCFGAAFGVDNTDASIVAAVRQGDRIIVEVIEHRPGTTWALPTLLQLRDKWPDAAFAIDRYGPSEALADQADRAGLELIDLNTSAVAASASNILAWITQPDPVHGPAWRWVPDAALDRAADIASRRYVQDGAWTFGRRVSKGSISALEAANAATWGIDHMPELFGPQLFIAGVTM